jgi:hypothetical protein
MERIKIGLRDKMFAHAETAGSAVLAFPDLPFTWDRTETIQPVTVFTDENIDEAINHLSRYNVAWLYESPEVTRKAYKLVDRHADKFQRILTFHQPLLEKHAHARFTPIGGCWLHERDWAVFPKKHNVSVIASSKKSLPGHKLRHTVIKENKSAIEFIAGSGYHPIQFKKEALQDFRYSICIENCRENFYFTEKLIDCFLTGTVPIYWGCPAIGLFFNLDGIVTFESQQQLKAALPFLNEADYKRRSAAIRMNFELAQRYVYVEKLIWENIASLTT